jgi:hypothetical protein
VPFTVSIMQPYFLPYAGYFRLISESDLFVIYDCVQFPRRGWVHRNKLVDTQGEERWLTLPLRGASQEVLIQDLEFPDDAGAEMAERLRPFAIDKRARPQLGPLLERLGRLDGAPVDYISDMLKLTCAYLDLPWNVIRSSSLGVPATFRGQDRIVEIARRMKAERYLNAPGGVDLYDPAAFAAHGMSLAFLPPYEGKGGSVLERMLTDDRDALRAAITPLPASLP